MLHDNEAQRYKRQNYPKIKELIRISFGLGVNLTSPSNFKDSLKIITVILIISSSISLYGHWSYVMRYLKVIAIMAESFGTALQTIIAIIKMIYYFFINRKLYILLSQVQTHEFLRKIEILHKEFPKNKNLKVTVDKIMEANWTNIRRQVVFYIVVCSTIITHYFYMAVFSNLYHYIKKTPNYQIIMPFPSIYPVWEEKGMSFPYYPIQLFLGTSADYIAGMCSVSFDGIFIVLAVHGLGLLKVLNTLFENSTSPDVPQERRVEYLRYCFLHYQRTYNYILTIDNIYKHVSLVQFLFSLIVWGIMLFQLSVGFESDKMTLLRTIMYLSACGYQIVLYCYNGQRITSECENMSMALYSCEWYNESEEFKKLVRMMMIRSTRVFNMNISWFTTMSLPTLMAMIKTSGSYFLLLRNLAE